MLTTLLTFIEKLLTLVAQLFIYRAGRTAARAEQQQETIRHVETAHTAADAVDRLDDAAVAQRLRERWQR